MNRNTVLGTLGVGLLLISIAAVSRQEAVSVNLTEPDRQSYDLANQSTTQTSPTTPTHMSKLATASNRFGFNLFAQINRESSPENTVISPSSIAIALALISNGTEGETKEELTTALELSGLDSTAVNQSYQQLIETLKTADPNVKLAIANSLWVNKDISLKEQFIAGAKFYQAQVSNLDFANFQTKGTINSWVAKNTNDKITEIVDSVSPQDALYLINAIYFKGIWTNKFEANATTEQPFHSGGESQTQPMMSQTGDYRYYESDRLQAVRLPYGKNEELGMYIFLPREDSNLSEFNQQLNIDRWQEWISQMRSQKGNITLPRFQLEYETDLIESLSELGINQIFDASQADFSAMTDTPVAVDTVKHKTFIEVNEEGTEAAAVTSIGIRITSAMPQDPPFEMNVNRPFFFAIRDDITETILFMGNVVKP